MSKNIYIHKVVLFVKSKIIINKIVRLYFFTKLAQSFVLLNIKLFKLTQRF